MVFPELAHPDRAVDPDGTSRDATVLLLHAHPDDETLATGGLMARLVADGVTVVLLTGTRGERGEVVPGPLKHLEGTPELVAERVAELARAMKELGVSDHRFVGEGLERRRVYADSGMQWGMEGTAIASVDAPADALTIAPLSDVVADTLAVVDEVLPDVLVSYDERGGYGHPDHVRMHDVAVEVSRLRSVPLYVIVPAAASASGTASAAASTLGGDVVVPLGEFRAAKVRALGAYATQLTVDGDELVMSGGQRLDLPDVEVFRRT